MPVCYTHFPRGSMCPGCLQDSTLVPIEAGGTETHPGARGFPAPVRQSRSQMHTEGTCILLPPFSALIKTHHCTLKQFKCFGTSLRTAKGIQSEEKAGSLPSALRLALSISSTHHALQNCEISADPETTFWGRTQGSRQRSLVFLGPHRTDLLPTSPLIFFQFFLFLF